jgi:hypothetical protein
LHGLRHLETNYLNTEQRSPDYKNSFLAIIFFCHSKTGAEKWQLIEYPIISLVPLTRCTIVFGSLLYAQCI